MMRPAIGNRKRRRQRDQGEAGNGQDEADPDEPHRLKPRLEDGPARRARDDAE